jgi:hypothetical protein
LYNAPTIHPSQYEWCIFGYEKDKEKKIKKLREKVFKLGGSHTNSHIVCINFVFVSFWNKSNENMVNDFSSSLLIVYYLIEYFQLPLIRVLKCATNANIYSYFVEPTGRTYDEWDDFINKNKLPECHICYPQSKMEKTSFYSLFRFGLLDSIVPNLISQAVIYRCHFRRSW